MKKIILCLTVLSAGVSFAADPKQGDTRDQVLDSLGQPSGKMMLVPQEILYFDRGTVELTDGKVTKVKLVSQADAEARIAKQKAETEAAAQQAAEQKQKLIEQGRQEKSTTLANTFFCSQTGAQQLAYWEDFSKRFPDVPVADEIQKATDLKQKEDQAQVDAAAAGKQHDESSKTNSALPAPRPVGSFMQSNP